MATHSSSLAWKIPWTKKPGRLQSIVSQRVRHHWSDLAQWCLLSLFSYFLNQQYELAIELNFSPLSLHYQEWFKERVWILFRNLLPGLVLRNKKIPFEIRKINPTWFLDPLSSNLWPFWRKTFIFSSVKRETLGYTEVKIYKVLLFSMLGRNKMKEKYVTTPFILQGSKNSVWLNTTKLKLH